MIDELSDEAYFAWTKQAFGEDVRQMGNRDSRHTVIPACIGFSTAREWRRRAEALIEQTFQDGVRKGCEISEVWTDREQVIEKERRKAFEWGMRSMGYHCSEKQVEENYRVYTEAAKEGLGALK